MNKFELPKDPKDLKNYNLAAKFDEIFTLPEETIKDKVIKIIKKTGIFIWTATKLIYKYTPTIILGILFLYLLFQVILFIGHTNTEVTNWKWATELAKNSPFHCFLAGTTFLESLSKLLIFAFTSCVLIFSLFLMAEVFTEYGSWQYLVAVGIVGVLYCLFNNKIYDIVSMLSLPLCAIGFMITRCCASGGGGGGSSSTVYTEDSSSDNSGWEKVKAEREERERRARLEKQRQDEEFETQRREQQRKHDTIQYAIDQPNGTVQIKFEDGHTRYVYGTLISSTNSTVTVRNGEFIKVYDINGNCKLTRKA